MTVRYGLKKVLRFLIGLHPLVLALVAVGSFCFSGAAFVRAYFVPSEGGGLENAGTIYNPRLDEREGESGLDSRLPELDGTTLPDTLAVDGEVVPDDIAAQLDSAPDEFKDGMFSMLLTGSQDDWNTDTIMVIRMDVIKGEVNVLSIPRDTKVNASRDIPKINAAYGVAKRKDDPEAGIKGLRRELAGVIGFFPKRYVYVDMKAFEKIVDAIGGVQFDVPYNMKSNPEDLVINLKKGPALLSGNEALQLIRYRHINHGEDLGRMKVQQDFLMAAAKQALVPASIPKIPEFIQIAQDHLKTDLTVGEMGWLADQLMKIRERNDDFLHFYTLPMKSAGSYVILDSEETLKLINEKISPFTQEITSDNVIHVTK